jgi:hypothetical protein
VIIKFLSYLEAYEREDVMDKKTYFPPTDQNRRNYNIDKGE